MYRDKDSRSVRTSMTNLLRDVEFTQTREAWVKLLEVYLTTSVLCGNDVIQRLESLTNLHDEDIAELVQFLRPYIESQSDYKKSHLMPWHICPVK